MTTSRLVLESLGFRYCFYQITNEQCKKKIEDTSKPKMEKALISTSNETPVQRLHATRTFDIISKFIIKRQTGREKKAMNFDKANQKLYIIITY